MSTTSFKHQWAHTNLLLLQAPLKGKKKHALREAGGMQISKKQRNHGRKGWKL